jgi:hypothetical protein
MSEFCSGPLKRRDTRSSALQCCHTDPKLVLLWQVRSPSGCRCSGKQAYECCIFEAADLPEPGVAVEERKRMQVQAVELLQEQNDWLQLPGQASTGPFE